MEADPRTVFHEHYYGLEPGSFTAEKLRYASAHHLHITSRRFFIGPIPEGWLQHHRKDWLKTRLKFQNYTSRTITFSADPAVSHHRDNHNREEPTSIAQEDDTAPTDTSDGVETESESEDNSDDHGPIQASGALQSIPYPLPEAAEVPPTPARDTGDTSSASPNERNYKPDRKALNAPSSYFTARESLVDTDQGPPEENSRPTPSIPEEDYGSQSSPIAPASESGSTNPLLGPKSQTKGKERSLTMQSTNLEGQEPQSEQEGWDSTNDRQSSERSPIRNSIPTFGSKNVKYNLEDTLLDKQQRFLARISWTYDALSGSRTYRRKVQEGEVIKAENMLVRVEETIRKELPNDYTENDSLRMETRVAEKWKEFLVTCRVTPHEGAPFALQMYKTRVIPELQKPRSKITPYYEIPLSRKGTRVNMYSSLDKTMVIWTPCKYGTRIYIIRPRSAVHAAEWYTFIRQVLGWRRPSSIPINVPDLGVSLIFRNPFEQLELGFESKRDSNGDGLSQSAMHERYTAAAIIRGCMEILRSRSELAEVLKDWSETDSMGLAWKRYDRLEWVYGANEEKMYGAFAMQATHQLQLRPRKHYDTYVRNGHKKEEEPQPVEGFLIRLTSRRGVHQRMNRMFFKRLYFFSQNNYLLFCRPAKAMPPAPPKLSPDSPTIPSSQQILDEIPLSYDVDPFPIQDGEITWLSSGNKAHIERHDKEAHALLQRSTHNLSHADGYIDLCRVQEVREVQRDSCPADPNIQEGSDVDFNPETRDTHRDDGASKKFKADRTFEMSLDNGLVIRLQAYNNTTRNEWMKRLDALVKYWKARSAADTVELKAVRHRNLELLGIDEELESIIGQFAKKWETKKGEASPLLHNMCALSGCRIIKMSGQLYRKPRRHSTFKKSNVILTTGKLLIFHSTLRQRNGVEIPHIHHSLETTIDLDDCYIYSGLLTDSDLLYGNQTFDGNHPGRRTLPRIYLSSDVYASCDEDTAITFVIWQPLRKNFFRAPELGETGETKHTLKQVSTLGVHGRTVVFKARSRIERDRWVMSISSEIDRIQEDRQEDIRIVKLRN